MIDPRLQDLQRRLDELVKWCQEVTLALENNPDREERRRLAAELQAITAGMKSVDAERRALAEELSLPAEGAGQFDRQ
jgi:hypothetical protein